MLLNHFDYKYKHTLIFLRHIRKISERYEAIGVQHKVRYVKMILWWSDQGSEGVITGRGSSSLGRTETIYSIKLYQNTAPAQIGTAWTPSWSQIQAGFVKPVSSSLRHRLKRSQSKDTGDYNIPSCLHCTETKWNRKCFCCSKTGNKGEEKGYDVAQHKLGEQQPKK